MSKVLLVIEEHFIKDSNGNIYSKRVWNDNLLSQYLKSFEKISVFARMEVGSGEDFSKFKKITLDNISFVEIPDYQGPKELLKLSTKIICLFKKAIKENNGVILRAPSPLSLLVYRFIPQNMISAVEFMMGADYFFESDKITARVLNKIVSNEAKKLVKRANGTIYVTKEGLQKDYPPNKRVFQDDNSNYFTSGVSDILLDDTFFYHKKSIKEKSSYVIACSGYMDTYRKGQHIAIDVIKILSDRGLDVKLKLIGSGRLEKELRERSRILEIEERVQFTGSISSQSDMRNELISSDVFILPSRLEGLPRVVIEAISVGLPAVISNVNGNYELIEKDFLVDGFNAEMYANRVELLLNNSSIYDRTSELNFKKSLEYKMEKLEPIRNHFYVKLAEVIKKGEQG